MVEALADLDDDIAHAFLEGQAVPAADLKRALRAGTLTYKIVPVLCGSALKNKGVQPMLDAVIEYLPSPLDVPPVTGTDPRTHEQVVRHTDPTEPFAALAFKIAADPFVGKLAFFRVYSGTLKSGSYVYNSTKDQKERVGRLVQLHANHREEVESVSAGDIAAAVGLKNTFTGDTLTDEAHPDRAGGDHASPSRSSSWRWSPRPRPTRTRWPSRSSGWPRKTRHSGSAPTRRRPRPGSRAWASSTWR